MIASGSVLKITRPYMPLHNRPTLHFSLVPACCVLSSSKSDPSWITSVPSSKAICGPSLISSRVRWGAELEVMWRCSQHTLHAAMESLAPQLTELTVAINNNSNSVTQSRWWDSAHYERSAFFFKSSLKRVLIGQYSVNPIRCISCHYQNNNTDHTVHSEHLAAESNN